MRIYVSVWTTVCTEHVDRQSSVFSMDILSLLDFNQQVSRSTTGQNFFTESVQAYGFGLAVFNSRSAVWEKPHKIFHLLCVTRTRRFGWWCFTLTVKSGKKVARLLKECNTTQMKHCDGSLEIRKDKLNDTQQTTVCFMPKLPPTAAGWINSLGKIFLA